MFPDPPRCVVGAAGRLSPEKGFSVLVDAAVQVCSSPRLRNGRSASDEEVPQVGFVLFGDGPLRHSLAQQIAVRAWKGSSSLPAFIGFRQVSSTPRPARPGIFYRRAGKRCSRSVCCRCARRTHAVGGTPEIIEDEKSGYLVPPGDAGALMRRITDMLADDSGRAELASRAREEVTQRFSFSSQAREYNGCSIPCSREGIRKRPA